MHGNHREYEVSKATLDLIADVQKMQTSVLNGPAAFRPGAFWDDLVDRNLVMLKSSGIENFKRTLANNYYNWMVTSLYDPQIQLAIKTWLRHPSSRPLRATLEGGGTVDDIQTLDRTDAYSYSRLRSWKYKTFVAAIWETARRLDQRGLTNDLSEPQHGNPLRVVSRGKLISQDLANSVIEFSYVDSACAVGDGTRVAELGAGYGRLADVFLKSCDVVYCVFDIPPALAVAQWYLTQVHGAERVVEFDANATFEGIVDRLTPGVVAFFTPAQMELFPDGWFDVTQTISTLPEMPREQAEAYLRLMAVKSKEILYLKQWKRWRNDLDQVELTEADYDLGSDWELVARRDDPIQPQFFNQIWRRVCS